ncbi:hypothetical protein EBB79_17915 [Parasedimentitalea marina]|uniref:Rhamnosyl transferase n=1 Tax=Parasedimentitalea marina TaxID=2483033 RepID=A0A3T0N688_9RHOB|nr:glycosyltransferase [Parasedimentitalea marina]AZV79564.1 hypothetical protein EBB79_17915 [Parasedimentitalea marina]
MDLNIKMVGLLRFSVLSPTYYSERFNTLDETAAHLFSPERMALRFRIFESLCLPSLMRQSDMDYTLVVLTSKFMPKPYLSHLRALLNPLPNVFCRVVGTGVHYRLLKRAYASVPLDNASHQILFRLDDDDAVDINFVRRTKHMAQGMIPLQGAETPFVLANNRGFYVQKGEDGVEVYDACEKAPLSTGTALVSPAGHGANPYRFNHRKFAQYFNTFSDISVPSFVRTIHGDNKSDPTQMGLTRQWGQARIKSGLKQHFDLSVSALEELLQ